MEPLSYICLYHTTFFRKPTRPSLPLRKKFFLPLRLSCKESSTFSPSPSSSGSGDVTALRCSEPLRSKVGGPSKVFARLCGMGPPSYYLAKGAGYYPYFKTTLACNKCNHLYFHTPSEPPLFKGDSRDVKNKK